MLGLFFAGKLVLFCVFSLFSGFLAPSVRVILV